MNSESDSAIAAEKAPFLTESQYRRFQEIFHVDENAIKITGGARKHVIMTAERVFLFPKTAVYATDVAREISIYQSASGLLSGPAMPKFLQRLTDDRLYPFEVGVVGRVPGVSLEEIQESVKEEEFFAVMGEYFEVAADFHSIPFSKLAPSCLVQRKEDRESYQPFVYSALDPAKCATTVKDLHATICKTAVEIGQPAPVNDLESWLKTIGELANLPLSFVHRDMHEGQILVRGAGQVTLTGVLDWELAGPGNPVLDFSFHIWGRGAFWKWHERFGELRRKLWKRYLDRRGLRVSSVESLHLFCTLNELARIMLLREKQPVTMIRKPWAESVQIYLARLSEITRLKLPLQTRG